MKTGDEGVDEVLSLVSESRRRQTLYCLLSNRTLDIDTIATQIAAWENNESIASVSKQAEESIKIALHHNHLPKLAEVGIIEYDGRSGDIVSGEGFDEIASTVEQLRENEDECDDVEDSVIDDEETTSFLNP